MRRAAAVLAALAALVAFAAPVPMAFWMSSAQHGHRSAHVTAYSLHASDFEVPARCAYLADVDTYVWQVKPDLAGPYAEADMVLFGVHGGEILAHRFTPRAGLAEPIVFYPLPKPIVSLTENTALVDWDLPNLGGAADRWELVMDGTPRPLPDSGIVLEDLAPGEHRFALRVVLAGEPRERSATGPEVRVEVAE